MPRPLLLDLYCGQGGAAHGYHKAGFRVIGVDIKPQPRYPYRFVQAEALEFLASMPAPELACVALIHASPPCQCYSVACARWPGRYPDLLPPTRDALQRTGRPYVIENVPGAPMRRDITLCGCMIGQPRLRRERWFETNWSGHVLRQPCRHHERVVSLFGHNASRKTSSGRDYYRPGLSRELMRCWWMSGAGLCEAIPPGYTERIGRMFLATEARGQKPAGRR